MSEVLLGLGSNLGDRQANLQRAVSELRLKFGDIALSKVYETAPMYVEDQPSFLNAAALVSSEAGPLATLWALKHIEQTVGRSPSRRFGPREIDIDLLAYGSVRYVFTDKGKVVLQIPHLKIAEREFVLRPVADLGANRVLPGLGRVCDLLGCLGTSEQVQDAVLSL